MCPFSRSSINGQHRPSCPILLHSDLHLSNHTSEEHLWLGWLQEEAGQWCAVMCSRLGSQSSVLFRVSVPSNSSHTHTLQSPHHGTHVFFSFHKLHLNCSGRNQQSRPVDPQTKPLRSCSQAIPTRSRHYLGESTMFPHMDQQPGWQWVLPCALSICLVRSRTMPDTGTAQGQVGH